MTEMLCRAAQLSDMESVHRIELLVQDFPWTVGQFADSLARHHFTVLEDVNTRQIAGFCILQPVLDEANLLLMAVHPELQGRGLGQRLLQSALDRLTPQPAIIFLEVRKSNLAAQRLYNKTGFVETGLRKNYYDCKGGSKEDALVMALTLSFQF